MDKKTFEYMKERVEEFKNINNKIAIIDKRIEFYENDRFTKQFGQTNNFIGRDNLGENIINKLTKVTIEVLKEEKEILKEQLNNI